MRPGSPLCRSVRDGLQALKRDHRDYLAEALRPAFTDSLDLDSAMEQGHETEHRWDYLLGHQESGEVIGLEPHSARSDQVSTVIAKRERARAQLREHLAEGQRIAAWYWVASGNVEFFPFDKAILRLAQSGITFVGTKLLPKHLPASAPVGPSPKSRARRGGSKR